MVNIGTACNVSDC